ncbi:MAG: DoxX family protein [Cyclobacteriaceae bacterium]
MTTKHVKGSKAWHISLWITQILLAGMFLMVGFMKTLTPLAELSQIIPLAAEMPVLIRFIGVSELAGGLGLLLPAALRIRPQLTVLAAAALALVMLLAIIFHIARGETSAIGTNIVLGVVAAFIAWGRVHKAPIELRPVQAGSVART